MLSALFDVNRSRINSEHGHDRMLPGVGIYPPSRYGSVICLSSTRSTGVTAPPILSRPFLPPVYVFHSPRRSMFPSVKGHAFSLSALVSPY